MTTSKKKNTEQTYTFTKTINTVGDHLYFEPFRPILDRIFEELNDFRLKIKAAEDGDESKIQLRDEAEETLRKSLKLYFSEVDALAKENETFVVKTGFEYDNNQHIIKEINIEMPINVEVSMLGCEKGSLMVNIQLKDRKSVLLTNVYYSTDGGVTWLDRILMDGYRCQIKDLPSFSEILIRARSFGDGSKYSGSGSAISDYTETISFYLP
jgi:hypothetical protein